MKDVLNVLEIVLSVALVGVSFAKFDRKLRLFAGVACFFTPRSEGKNAD